MNTFFLENSLCFSTYLLVIVLLMLSVIIKKYKAIPLFVALTLFVADLTCLLLLGLSLDRAAILCGICVIFVLLSIREGRSV